MLDALFDDPNHAEYLVCCRNWVGQRRLKVQVDYVVAVVCYGDFVSVDLVVGRAAHAQHRLAARRSDRRKRGDEPHRVLVTKRNDFHRDREVRPEAVAELRLIHNHDELLRADLDHLLPEEGTASTFDQILWDTDQSGELRTGKRGAGAACQPTMSGSTESAPSMATSSSDASLRVQRGMLRLSACSLVRTEVGICACQPAGPTGEVLEMPTRTSNARRWTAKALGLTATMSVRTPDASS